MDYMEIGSINNCSFTAIDTKLAICKELPQFYNSLLSAWTLFIRVFDLKSRDDILNAPLFGNNEIRFHRKPLLFQAFIKSGLHKISHIWNVETKMFITETQLLSKLLDIGMDNFAPIYTRVLH